MASWLDLDTLMAPLSPWIVASLFLGAKGFALLLDEVKVRLFLADMQ